MALPSLITCLIASRGEPRRIPIVPIKASAQPKKAKPVQVRTPANTQDAPVVAKAVKPSGDVVKLEELTASMFCWPEGEPGTEDFHFCGQPSVPEKPYCEAHCARAYVKVSKDKKKKSSFEAA